MSNVSHQALTLSPYPNTASPALPKPCPALTKPSPSPQTLTLIVFVIVSVQHHIAVTLIVVILILELNRHANLSAGSENGGSSRAPKSTDGWRKCGNVSILRVV